MILFGKSVHIYAMDLTLFCNILSAMEPFTLKLLSLAVTH